MIQRSIWSTFGLEFVILTSHNPELGFPGGSGSKESSCNAEYLGSIPGLGRSPGGGHGTHSSILAWRIPGTGEPGGLPSVGSRRVRHDWSDLAASNNLSVFNHEIPLPVCSQTYKMDKSETSNAYILNISSDIWKACQVPFCWSDTYQCSLNNLSH